MGAGVAIASLVAAASIAQGAVSYLGVILPLPAAALTTTLVVSFTAVALLGVRGSVGLAAVIGALEIAGLLIAATVGFTKARNVDLHVMLAPAPAAWPEVISTAFIAFFAFIGFETLTKSR